MLGRYDAEGLRAALCGAAEELRAAAGQAERELEQKGRMERVLGPDGGGHAGHPPVVRSGTMNVDLIFRIAAIGILISVLNQVLTRSGREEQATMTTLAGLVVVLMMVVQEISDLFDLVKNLFGL